MHTTALDDDRTVLLHHNGDGSGPWRLDVPCAWIIEPPPGADGSRDHARITIELPEAIVARFAVLAARVRAQPCDVLPSLAGLDVVRHLRGCVACAAAVQALLE